MSRARFLEVVAAERGQPGKARIQEYHRSAIGPTWGGARELEWCGLFCLWGLHEAGLALDVLWRIRGGFCEEQRLPRVKSPEVGDIAYFHAPFRHHAVVESAHDGILTTIDGNQLGDTVQRKTRSGGSASVFYSIRPFLERSDTDPAPPPSVRPTIKWGSEGPDVLYLQQRLNKLGHALREDGNLGRVTAAALASFQRRAGLDADSVCGPKTWAALEIVP